MLVTLKRWKQAFDQADWHAPVLQATGPPAGSALATALAAMEAEDGAAAAAAAADEHVCMVCKEGCRLQPAELLAAYVFCKRLSAAEAGGAAPLEGLALPRAAGFVLSSVSHFNLIHVKCHAAARRADAALRTPKRWDI